MDGIKMRILITGSQGSLASMIIPHLKGHTIVGMDKVDRQDLTDPQCIPKEEYDLIIHCAALIYGVVGFHKCPADILADNILMTINLLKYAKTKKFVYISSSMVYERCLAPHKETDTQDSKVMHTEYGLSKYVCERLVRAFHKQYGLTYTIWRPFNIITPYEKPKEAGVSHANVDLIEKIMVKKQMPLEIFGDGEQIRCYTSIHETAYAIAKFSIDPKSDNQTFNLANREPISMKELARLIVEIGKPKDYKLTFKSLPIFGDDVRERIPNVSKMIHTFDWEAKIKIRQSLKECI
jgi:nucleoside-diphosphate-sugar epimerase